MNAYALFFLTPGSVIIVGFLGVVARKALPKMALASMLTLARVEIANERLAIREDEIEQVVELMVDG